MAAPKPEGDAAAKIVGDDALPLTLAPPALQLLKQQLRVLCSGGAQPRAALPCPPPLAGGAADAARAARCCSRSASTLPTSRACAGVGRVHGRCWPATNLSARFMISRISTCAQRLPRGMAYDINSSALAVGHAPTEEAWQYTLKYRPTLKCRAGGPGLARTPVGILPFKGRDGSGLPRRCQGWGWQCPAGSSAGQPGAAVHDAPLPTQRWPGLAWLGSGAPPKLLQGWLNSPERLGHT